MLKKRTLFSIVLAIILSLVVLPHGTVFAKFADGTYSVPYEMKSAGNDSTSIADGYFGKPAKVTVDGGTYTVQITLTGAEMIESLSGPNGPVNVVSDSGDTRVVSFTTNTLSDPISMDMHIIVPDQPAMPGGYDQKHTARAVFDTSAIPAAGSEDTADKEGSASEEAITDGDEKPAAEDNPPTGDNSQIMLYGLLLVGSAVAVLVIRKLRLAND